MKKILTIIFLINSFLLLGNYNAVSDTIYIYKSYTVLISEFTATDDRGVVGYLVNESPTTPSVNDTGWSSTPQSQYVFSSEGTKTLYAWAKDSTGNISDSKSVKLIIELPDSIKPIVTSFVIQTISASRTIPIKSFLATDNKAVTGYIITESSTPPLANDTGWSATKPTSYTFTSAGSKRLYAWVKDGAGNVSNNLNRGIKITR